MDDLIYNMIANGNYPPETAKALLEIYSALEIMLDDFDGSEVLAVIGAESEENPIDIEEGIRSLLIAYARDTILHHGIIIKDDINVRSYSFWLTFIIKLSTYAGDKEELLRVLEEQDDNVIALSTVAAEVMEMDISHPFNDLLQVELFLLNAVKASLSGVETADEVPASPIMNTFMVTYPEALVSKMVSEGLPIYQGASPLYYTKTILEFIARSEDMLPVEVLGLVVLTDTPKDKYFTVAADILATLVTPDVQMRLNKRLNEIITLLTA